MQDSMNNRETLKVNQIKKATAIGITLDCTYDEYDNSRTVDRLVLQMKTFNPAFNEGAAALEEPISSGRMLSTLVVGGIGLVLATFIVLTDQ